MTDAAGVCGVISAERAAPILEYFDDPEGKALWGPESLFLFVFSRSSGKIDHVIGNCSVKADDEKKHELDSG